MATITAYVYVSSSNTPSIWPPVLIARKNDDVEIVNMTDDDIFVIYPAQVFAEGSAGNKDPQKSGKAAKKGGRAEKKVANDPKVGLHRFKVFCYATDSFAQANSDPEFIIEP